MPWRSLTNPLIRKAIYNNELSLAAFWEANDELSAAFVLVDLGVDLVTVDLERAAVMFEEALSFLKGTAIQRLPRRLSGV